MIAVAAESFSLNQKAAELAQALQLPVVSLDSQDYPCLLVVMADRLALKSIQHKNTKMPSVDFLSPQLIYRCKTNQRELLKRAMGSLNPLETLVVDATAGFGEDAFLLARKGYSVIMFERSTILAALLKDGLMRLHDSTEKLPPISLALRHGDARVCLPALAKERTIDAIYLDPMFPDQKKTALSKAKMEILRGLVGPDEDAVDLLTVALKLAKNRVIVKRPRLAPWLGNIQPAFSLKGSSNRFDVYFTRP